jgi:hypothetical protein
MDCQECGSKHYGDRALCEACRFVYEPSVALCSFCGSAYNINRQERARCGHWRPTSSRVEGVKQGTVDLAAQLPERTINRQAEERDRERAERRVDNLIARLNGTGEYELVR